MDVRKLIEILSVAEKLKNNTRHSWTSSGRQESVAEHSWRLALMAYLVKDEFPDADINKVILMCIIHDLGEAFTGDIPSFNKTDDDELTERQNCGCSWTVCRNRTGRNFPGCLKKYMRRKPSRPGFSGPWTDRPSYST